MHTFFTGPKSAMYYFCMVALNEDHSKARDGGHRRYPDIKEGGQE